MLVAIALGVLLGHYYPETGAAMKPLGDGFIKLIKMLIAPIIFCTVVLGIAGMEDMKKVGKTGGLALLYFEVVSTIALIIGLVVVNLVRPGAGMNVDPASLDASAVAQYAQAGTEQSITGFLLNIIPDAAVGAFTRGDILQVLLFAVLFGFALHAVGREGALFRMIEQASQVLFRIVAMIMRLAPIGAFGAMAFTIGKYGVDSLTPLAQADGLLLRHLPDLHPDRAGEHRAPARIQHPEVHPLHQGGAVHRPRYLLVGVRAAADDRGDGEPRGAQVRRRARHPNRILVQPGRHFDLPHDGRSVRRAGNQHAARHLFDQIVLLGVLLLTSKGAAGVTGSGFIVLAATLSAVGHVPVAGLALILGIDRFMSEARALTNLIGNGVATVVVGKWCGQLDEQRLRDELQSPGT